MKIVYLTSALIAIIPYSAGAKNLLPIHRDKNGHESINVVVTTKGQRRDPRTGGYNSTSVADFGDIPSNTTQTITFTMIAAGGIDSQVNQALVQSGSAAFVVSNDECSGADVAHTPCTFDVTYEPTSTEIDAGEISVSWVNHYTFNGNAESDSGTASYVLEGSSYQPPPLRPKTDCGSIVNVDAQSLGEQIPIVGAPFALYYSSARSSQYLTSNFNFSGLSNKFSFSREEWSNSLQHLYSTSQRRIFYGDGRIVTAEYSLNSDGTLLVPSADGSEIYNFSADGQHLKTLNPRTGTTKYTFNYDSSNNLISIVDAFGSTTTLTRNASGYLTQVVAPHGQATIVGLNSNNQITSVTNPNNETYAMTYSSGTSLLSTFTKPAGQVSTFTYDSYGHLLKDLGNGGNFWTLTAGSNGALTETSEMGRSTTYSNSYDSSGNYTSASVDPTALSSTHTEYGAFGPHGSTDSNAFSTRSSNSQDDPRFGPILQMPLTIQTSIGNLTSTTSYSAAVVYPSGTSSGFFNYTSLTQQSTTSNRAATDVFNLPTLTDVKTSPAGATVTTQYNSSEQPVSIQVGSDSAATMSYDSLGRVTSTAQGSQNSTTFAYNAAGFLASVTNALNQVTSYAYDLVGRNTSVTLPDSRTVGYTYDANGNVSSITPPSRPAHGFTENALELLGSYLPPALTGITTVSTTYAYNLDKQPTIITRPDGSTITNTYNSTSGLLTSTAVAAGSYQYSYVPNSGLISKVVSPDGYYNNYTYNGKLVTNEDQGAGSTSWGNVSYSYDTDFRLSQRTVMGMAGTASSSRTIGYNNDNKITSFGPMALTFEYPSGRLSTTTVGTVSDLRTYDTYGRIISYTATYTPTSGTPSTLYTYTLTRDTLGRVSTRSETLQGATNAFAYTYDSSGRLSTVLKNGAAFSSYTYDNNGNRTSGSTAGTAFTATFDNQDRKLTHGSKSFTYNANGDRTSTVFSPTQTATFQFDELGALKSETTSTGIPLVWSQDGLNRRVHKTASGSFNAHYLYDLQNRIVAAESSAGAISAEYIYASGQTAPDCYYGASSVLYRNLTDDLGSVRLVVNASTGAIAQRIDYDDMGAVFTDTSSGFQPFYWAGGLYDKQTLTLRFGAREYDPRFGAWMTKDPILFKGGDTNLYGYVLNDPVNFVDPEGTQIATAEPIFEEAVPAAAEMCAAVATGAAAAFSALMSPPKTPASTCAAAFDAARAGCERMDPGPARNQCTTNATIAYINCTKSAK